MNEAIASADAPPEVVARLRAYVEMAAESMRNRD
jgi:hypothetical protein